MADERSPRGWSRIPMVSKRTIPALTHSQKCCEGVPCSVTKASRGGATRVKNSNGSIAVVRTLGTEALTDFDAQRDSSWHNELRTVRHILWGTTSSGPNSPRSPSSHNSSHSPHSPRSSSSRSPSSHNSSRSSNSPRSPSSRNSNSSHNSSRSSSSRSPSSRNSSRSSNSPRSSSSRSPSSRNSNSSHNNSSRSSNSPRSSSSHNHSPRSSSSHNHSSRSSSSRSPRNRVKGPLSSTSIPMKQSPIPAQRATVGIQLPHTIDIPIFITADQPQPFSCTPSPDSSEDELVGRLHRAITSPVPMRSHDSVTPSFHIPKEEDERMIKLNRRKKRHSTPPSSSPPMFTSLLDVPPLFARRRVSTTQRRHGTIQLGGGLHDTHPPNLSPI